MSQANAPRFAVLGAGSFGTVIANDLAKRKSSGLTSSNVLLWCRDPEQSHYINENHKNPKRLKQYELDKNLAATSDLNLALANSSHVIIAVPTQSVRALLKQIASVTELDDKKLLSLAKGIEIATGMMPHQIYKELLPDISFTALSGPSLAAEVAQGLPTAVICASENKSDALEWQSYLNSPHFRVYTSGDVTGVELSGAVKNVIAIAAGAAAAMGLGDNARAALATRGLAEMMRLGAALGAEPLTLAGLAGVGDLMATCYSAHSRNFRFGQAIGHGKSPDAAIAEIGEVVEGAHTVRALVAWARRVGTELPISECVNAFLYEGASLQDIIGRLLFRDPKAE